MLLSRPVIITLFLGCASGLPNKLTGSTLQVWLKESGFDLELIGLFSLVGLPYALKFLWAPIFDNISFKFLGRRRSWIFITQIAVFLATFLLGIFGVNHSPFFTAALALLVSFSSASLDTVIDAHRRDTLSDKELGLGASFFVIGYRLALLISGALSIYLSKFLSWNEIYIGNSFLILFGIIPTFLAPEPSATQRLPFKDAVIKPLKDLYLRCKNYGNAFYMLLFVLLFKIGDSLAAVLTIPYFQELLYSKDEIALYGEIVGLISMLLGGVLGGVVLTKYNLNKVLWISAFLQAVSTLAFVSLNHTPHNLILFALVEIFEKSTSGFGAVAFVTFLMRLTNKTYSATQYAILTSLMVICGHLIGAYSGYFVTDKGWDIFFISCTLAALPGMLLLLKIAPWGKENQQ